LLLVPAMSGFFEQRHRERATRGGRRETVVAHDPAMLLRRAEEIAVMRKPTHERTEAEVDVLVEMCRPMRYLAQGIKNEDDRRGMCRALQYAYFGAGQAVCKEGQVGEEMYFVLSGQLTVATTQTERGDDGRPLKDGEGRPRTVELVLATLTAGDHFGELALLEPSVPRRQRSNAQ
jgi:CRP-like cAMP-binding protein